MEYYHVLSNDMLHEVIMNYAVLATLFLTVFFSQVASRNCLRQEEKKGRFRRLAPWLVLLVFLSEAALFVARLWTYPWDVEAQPSQASIYRELQYCPTDVVFFGWANDYQLPLLSSLMGSMLWLCWTIYAFNYRPSPIPRWKKACKFVAYFILSLCILGFRIHELDDIVYFAVAGVIVAVLLWIAQARPVMPMAAYGEMAQQASPVTENASVCEGLPVNNEDPSRFMPKESLKEGAVADSECSDSAEQIAEQVQYAHEQENLAETDNASEEKSQIPQEPAEPQMPEMMYCKYCGKVIEADSKFCKYCGRSL